MKYFLLVLVFEFITASLFFYRIKDDTTDGDLVLGLLFWALCILYAAGDTAWLAVLVWKAVHP